MSQAARRKGRSSAGAVSRSAPQGARAGASAALAKAETLDRLGVAQPKQKRSEESLERMLAAAEAVMARDGWEALTMQAIAAEAGMSVGGLYRRFPSKTHLMRALKERAFAAIDARTSGIATYQARDLSDAVRHFVETRVAGAQRNQKILRQLLIGHEEDPVSMERVSRSGANTMAVVEGLFAPFRDEITHPDPSLAVETVCYMLNATLQRKLRDSAGDRPFKRMNWKALSEELTAMIDAYLRCVY